MSTEGAGAGGDIRWGIAGPGRMAEQFVADFAHVDGATPVAVGSRSKERAEGFAARHGIARAHGSYAELCADPEVDVVYIATPHPQHRAIALEAIRNGKAVLVEKAFAATLEGAREVVAEARKADVFAMEAMWTRFQPVVRLMHEVIDHGQIGRVQGVIGDLHAHRDFDPEDRLFKPELGGGALLDLGVYVLSFAQDFLGDAEQLLAVGSLYPNGADEQVAMSLGYSSGQTAALSCSLESAGPGQMVVHGNKGWIEVHPRFHHPTRISIHRSGAVTREEELRPLGKGYSHEIIEVNRCLREGLTESPVMPLDDTLAVMAQLEHALAQVGVVQFDDPDVV